MTASPNLDLVRSIYAAWERGDFSSTQWTDPERSRERAHPEIEFVFADGPSPGRWSGIAGMAEAARDWVSAWEEVRVEADEYRELDEERVLVFVRRSGRGKASGLELGRIQTHGANLLHLCDGKVTRFVVYWDRDRALADLGLAPEAGPPGS